MPHFWHGCAETIPAERSIHVAPLAEADLEAIWLYTFQNWSAEQADSYHADIMSALAGLASGSRFGRDVDVREGYLKYPVGAHLVFYRVRESGIDVIRILHQRMDVARHL
jgi:toxin ParE1/3/4